MALKKINVDTLVYGPVSVYWDTEHQEYVVKVSGAPDATYHTTDKQDAISTAQWIRNNLTRLD